jgi:rhodanese-related sulfurtransferase
MKTAPEKKLGKKMEAKKKYDSGAYLFVDARSGDEFDRAHITGAISFPVREFDSTIEAFIARYDPSTPLIIYCSGRECTDSHELAQLLMDVGYSTVKVFVDGFPAWKSGGLPVD